MYAWDFYACVCPSPLVHLLQMLAQPGAVGHPAWLGVLVHEGRPLTQKDPLVPKLSSYTLCRACIPCTPPKPSDGIRELSEEA